MDNQQKENKLYEAIDAINEVMDLVEYNDSLVKAKDDIHTAISVLIEITNK